MRSLFYRFDRCRWVPYEEWDGARPDPGPRAELTNLAVDEHLGPADQELRFLHYLEDLYGYEAIEARKNDVPESDLREGYKVYEALCQDTADICETGYDLKCLRSLFKGCRKLCEVTIASHVGCNRRLNGELKAFSQAMTVIDEDWNRKDAGVHQVLTVAQAAQESSVALDSLTISYVSQELFDTSHSALRALVRPLRRLRIAIHALPPRRVQCGDLYDSDRDDDIDDDDNEGGEGDGPRNA
jgi:hypothetical protein